MVHRTLSSLHPVPAIVPTWKSSSFLQLLAGVWPILPGTAQSHVLCDTGLTQSPETEFISHSLQQTQSTWNLSKGATHSLPCSTVIQIFYLFTILDPKELEARTPSESCMEPTTMSPLETHSRPTVNASMQDKEKRCITSNGKSLPTSAAPVKQCREEGMLFWGPEQGCDGSWFCSFQSSWDSNFLPSWP